MQILVVEDEWLQAENLEALLAVQGHTICGAASSGEQALTLAKAECPEIVMMDVKLRGEIDGVEAAEKLRRALPTCQVVFVTAYLDGKTMERMRSVNPAAIVEKPTKLREVEEAVALAAAKANAAVAKRG